MLTGAQNGIMGDESSGFELPVTEVPVEQLAIEKNMAKFSRSKEFKALKDYLQTRIDFYRNYLPDGRELTDTNAQPSGEDWRLANAVIREFTTVINAYEQAQQALKDQVKK